MKARGDWYVKIKKYSVPRSCLSWSFGKQRVSVYSLCMPWKCVHQSGSSMCHILPLSSVTHWWPVTAKKIWRQVWSKNSHWSQSHGIWWVMSLAEKSSVKMVNGDFSGRLPIFPLPQTRQNYFKEAGEGEKGGENSRASQMTFGWCKTWAARFMCGTWVCQQVFLNL